MANEPILECSFLVPIRRDANLSDGDVHPEELWEWLHDELYQRFGGATRPSEFSEGFYRDPNTGQMVSDKSKRYIVAVPQSSLDNLRSLLSAMCLLFQQKCIYLSIAGNVEFIEAPHG